MGRVRVVGRYGTSEDRRQLRRSLPLMLAASLVQWSFGWARVSPAVLRALGRRVG